MSIFRAAFLVFTVLAVAGTSYVSYYGAGGESRDLDKSVRTGSGGRVIGLAGSVK